MELLGIGREAEVYAVSDTECLKLYYPNYQRAFAQREADNMAVAMRANVGAPACYGLTERDGRVGLRIERIHGRSLLSEALANPARVAEYGEMMGRQLRRIHSAPGAGGEDMLGSMRWCVRHAPELTHAEQEAICERLEGMERGDRLVHRDYHLDNLLLTADGPRVIDWSCAACGHPLADAARTLLTCELAVYPPEADDAHKALLDSARGYAAEGFLRGYGAPREALAPWIPYVAAARLCCSPPDEYACDLRIVKAFLA